MNNILILDRIEICQGSDNIICVNCSYHPKNVNLTNITQYIMRIPTFDWNGDCITFKKEK